MEKRRGEERGGEERGVVLLCYVEGYLLCCVLFSVMLRGAIMLKSIALRGIVFCQTDLS